MEVKSIPLYTSPRYPTWEYFGINPERLMNYVPIAWLRNKLVDTALRLFASSNDGSGESNESSDVIHKKSEAENDTLRKARLGKDNSVSIAPIFIHGEGRGTIGCVVASPPVFISEDEAKEIILNEMAKEGVVFDKNDIEVKDIFFPDEAKRWTEPRIVYHRAYMYRLILNGEYRHMDKTFCDVKQYIADEVKKRLYREDNGWIDLYEYNYFEFKQWEENEKHRIDEAIEQKAKELMSMTDIEICEIAKDMLLLEKAINDIIYEEKMALLLEDNVEIIGTDNRYAVIREWEIKGKDRISLVIKKKVKELMSMTDTEILEEGKKIYLLKYAKEDILFEVMNSLFKQENGEDFWQYRHAKWKDNNKEKINALINKKTEELMAMSDLEFWEEAKETYSNIIVVGERNVSEPQLRPMRRWDYTLILDAFCSKHNIGIAYVSLMKRYRINGRDGCSVEKIDVIETARLLREKFIEYGKMNAVVFYDPMASQQSMAKRKLKKQIADFIQWLKEENILDRVNSN